MAQTQEVRRSTREKCQSVRLSDYEIFLDPAISENGDLIEEATIIEYEPTDLRQALKDENWQEYMKKELKAIEK